MSFDLFDLQPLTEYELYIKSFGMENTRQVTSTHCHTVSAQAMEWRTIGRPMTCVWFIRACCHLLFPLFPPSLLPLPSSLHSPSLSPPPSTLPPLHRSQFRQVRTTWRGMHKQTLCCAARSGCSGLLRTSGGGEVSLGCVTWEGGRWEGVDAGSMWWWGEGGVFFTTCTGIASTLSCEF